MEERKAIEIINRFRNEGKKTPNDPKTVYEIIQSRIRVTGGRVRLEVFKMGGDGQLIGQGETMGVENMNIRMDGESCVITGEIQGKKLEPWKINRNSNLRIVSVENGFESVLIIRPSIKEPGVVTLTSVTPKR